MTPGAPPGRYEESDPRRARKVPDAEPTPSRRRTDAEPALERRALWIDVAERLEPLALFVGELDRRGLRALARIAAPAGEKIA